MTDEEIGKYWCDYLAPCKPITFVEIRDGLVIGGFDGGKGESVFKSIGIEKCREEVSKHKELQYRQS